MWRNTGYGGKVLGVDYRALFPLLLFFLHIRWWTFWVAATAIVILAVVERFGYTVPVALRSLRMLIAGPTKLAVSIRRAPARRHIKYLD